jgi:hypothetical protein
LRDVGAPTFSTYQFTDGGEVVSITCRPAALYSRKDSWYSFLSKAESTQGHGAAGKISPIEKSNDLIGNRTRDILTRRIAPQPTTLPRAPKNKKANYYFADHSGRAV